MEERKFGMAPRVSAALCLEEFGRGEEEGETRESARTIEPYPYFGKVINGFDVADKIAKAMTRAWLPKRDEGGRRGTMIHQPQGWLLCLTIPIPVGLHLQ